MTPATTAKIPQTLSTPALPPDEPLQSEELDLAPHPVATSETDDSHVASDSTGVQSQLGATWRHAQTATMNSGFAWGTPRSEKYKGVREGREEGVPRGVGRTGQGPAPVPLSMLRALGVVKEEARPNQEEAPPKEDNISTADEQFLTDREERIERWVSRDGNWPLTYMVELNDAKNSFIKKLGEKVLSDSKRLRKQGHQFGKDGFTQTATTGKADLVSEAGGNWPSYFVLAPGQYAALIPFTVLIVIVVMYGIMILWSSEICT